MNEELKEIKEKIKRSSKYILYVEFSDIKKLLKNIEKQQEQIEELREICNKYNDMKYFAMVADRYISKDKIKEKIEEITSYAYTSASERDCQDYAIQSLKELLGE